MMMEMLIACEKSEELLMLSFLSCLEIWLKYEAGENDSKLQCGAEVRFSKELCMQYTNTLLISPFLAVQG